MSIIIRVRKKILLNKLKNQFNRMKIKIKKTLIAMKHMMNKKIKLKQ